MTGFGSDDAFTREDWLKSQVTPGGSEVNSLRSIAHLFSVYR